MARTASSIMRQRITLQARTLTRNEYGEEVPSWADVVVMCGSFEPLRGSEYFAAGAEKEKLPQEVARIDARIRIRERQGINPAENRVIHGGIVYDIVSVIQDRERRQTQLMVAARSVEQPDGSRINA